MSYTFLIIGHELHSHTHSYVYNGIYRSLKYMKYDVDWVYDRKDIDNIIGNGKKYDIIITELCHNKYIPLIPNCKYIIQQPFIELYRGSGWKYASTQYVYKTDEYMSNILKNVPKKNIIIWRTPLKLHSEKLFDITEENDYKIIICPWATDLLPEEINKNIENLKKIKNDRISNFIGTMTPVQSKFKYYCKMNRIIFKNYSSGFDKNNHLAKSTEENKKLIQESLIASSLQDDYQVSNNYIPCRIFKNISYGKIGVTNNKVVNELFDNKLVYSENIEELVKKSIEFEKREDKYELLSELMKNVRDNHTYVNRMNFILSSIIDDYTYLR